MLNLLNLCFKIFTSRKWFSKSNWKTTWIQRISKL